MTAQPNPSACAYPRAPVQPENYLLRHSLTFLSSLPADVFPCELARRFPRIVNQLARHWGNVSKTERYLQGLLVSERPGRRGFPPAVVRELAALSEHYENRVCCAPPGSVWDHDPRTLRSH